MTKATVYLETSVVGYATSRPSRDLIVAVPRNAAEDALHIAVAAVHSMEYLLTWNCKHIANATLRQAIESACREAGYEPPVICTPEELVND